MSSTVNIASIGRQLTILLGQPRLQAPLRVLVVIGKHEFLPNLDPFLRLLVHLCRLLGCQRADSMPSDTGEGGTCATRLQASE
jgi:hypothetical protein